MRKRSDVAVVQAASERTEPMFEQKPEPPAIPPRTERPPKPRGASALTFLTCPSCGLKQSAGSVAQAGDLCMRCDAPMAGAVQEEALKINQAEDMGALSPGERDRLMGELPQTKGKEVPPPSQDAPTTRKRGNPTPDDPGPVEGRIGASPTPDLKPVLGLPPEPAKGGISGAGYEPCCPTCLKPLTKTALGNFASCGCPLLQPKHASPVTSTEVVGIKPVLAASGAPTLSTAFEDESVSVTWGEESLKVADYCNVKVGPFSTTVAIRSGETIERAQHRANSESVVFAEAERERKVESFKRALKKATGQ